MNTTDNIKSLFNSANPMTTENIYEPSGVCIGDTLLDNTPSGFALFQAIGGHYTSPAQAIEELVDNAISSIRANGGSGEVILRLTDGGDYVDISIYDSGTGISDLGAALTISGRGGAQTPLNEHGCGLKNALSYLCEEVEVWLLESRTKEDAAADRYRCVSAPYAAIDRKMRAKVHQGNGAILHETGTTIRVRCSKEKFESLKPATKRAKADFRQLCGYLEEELAYTYATILAEGRITIGIICREQNAHESCHRLEALEPLWEADPIELPETPADFGGGKVTVRCCYGTIEADKENATYYKGNMASSGLEIRINGRCIERGLYSKVFGKALHPSCNRFLAQIDLRGEDGIAFPATETTKNAFVEGDARTQALFRWIRANVRQPETSRESLESRLVGKLAEKKAAESDTLRIGREEGTYRTIGLQGKIDLLVSKTDGMTIYEAKAKGTKAEDLYQLRLYADGCAMDGVPAKESVLIGARHPKEVCSLAEQLNSQCDPTGAPYHFVLRTWAEEGISA